MDFKGGDDTAMALDIETQDDAGDAAVVKAIADQKAVSMDKQDQGSEQLVAEAAGAALAGAMAEVAKEAVQKEDRRKSSIAVSPS